MASVAAVEKPAKGKTPAAQSVKAQPSEQVAKAQSPAQPASKPAPPKENLETVLDLMDRTAANFHNLETDFVWDQYQKVVDEHDKQSGKMFFRRTGDSVEMAADISEPDKKYVLFSGGKVQVFQPKIEQVTEYNAGKNKADFESFLVLGFGGRGHDLLKSFDVKLVGTETVNGSNTYKLELTPKTARVKGIFQTITLWIDREHGMSVQQKFVESSGDYRLATYSNIKSNGKLSDGVFKLKTTGKTKFIKPQG
jgi:outer membrane lipoprotein-sorting protein